mgnify:FL=1|nr:MAG TPA: hypothetical protein [Caudoviricetes sp.]
MQQSIRYKGLSLTPDEMAVENGALSLCGNLELHDGALRPSIVTGTPLSQPLTINGVVAKILYVHETGNYRHLIAIASSAIYWFLQDGSLGSTTPIKSFDYEASVLSVNSIGNTLIIVATDGIHYALWVDGGYVNLPQKPPFVEITFSISDDYPENYTNGGVDAEGSANGFREAFQQTTYSCNDVFDKVKMSTNIIDLFLGDSECLTIKEDKQSDLTQSIYALINRTNNLIARKGRFYANFFVRYCYRMFDGSMIMHSSPVFIPVQIPDSYMVLSANAISQVTNGTIDTYDDFTFQRKDGKNNTSRVHITKAAFIYYPRNVDLRYTILDAKRDELKKWKDVIKSVDIFITPPISNVDTSEKISSLRFGRKNYMLGKGLLSLTYKSDKAIIGETSVYFPSLSQDAYRNKLKNTSAFYKVCSFKLSDLAICSAKKLPVDKNAVYQVSLQEQMKDDYKTHNSLFAQGGYVYNHRLNLYGMKEKLFQGFNGCVMLPGLYTLKYDDSIHDLRYKIQKIVVSLNTTSGTKYVESSDKFFSRQDIDVFMISNLVKFYPDSRADKMAIFCKDSSDNDVIFVFPLEQCAELNGAMHMGDFTDNFEQYKVESFDYTVDDVVELSNKIYTSESDNAFYFPLNGINTVGIGTIQGIASTTRALSQGQFGQYPLMAFSTDGIWAMEVSSKGTYSSIHPISREVCSNPKSITQLDQSVLFATNRSISRIAESQVVSMSDVLDGPGFNIYGLGKFLNFFNDTEEDSDTVKSTKAQMRQLIDFTSSPIEFFQRCQVIYDYKNSRILCLDVTQTSKTSTADTVALCYSIKDNAWSTFLIQNVLTAINSYPHPYIQYRDGSVMVLDKGYDYEDTTEYHGIIVTRTLKFDEDNVPDSITGYIHSLTSGSIPIMWLYGSNDNQNWHYIGRLGGMKSSYMATHSYRFFRIALYLKMKSINQYFATRLEIIRRFSKF